MNMNIVSKRTTFAAMAFIAISFFVLPAVRPSSAAELKNAGESRKADEKFDRVFEEARVLMDKEEWAKAAAKFNEIVCDSCGKNRRSDAALYWLAHCYRKQNLIRESNAVLERLEKDFPQSTWADDARVMRLQIATRGYVVRSDSSGQGTSIASAGPSLSNKSQLLESAVFADARSSNVENKLEREDEIRLAAFQSLYAGDPKKGIEALARLLRPDSKASNNLKIEVLRSVRGRGFTRTLYPADVTASSVVNEINPMLRDALTGSYRSEQNVKIRAEILYSISSINDAASVNFLAQAYTSEQDRDLKKAIINSFVSGFYTTWDSRNFSSAVYWDGSAWVNGRNQTMTTTTAAASAPAQSGTATASTAANPIRDLRFNSLMTIFKSEKDSELRRLALGNIQRFAGWSSREGMVDMLAQLYDSESDEQFKGFIIYTLSSLSNNKTATNKLLDIAKNDKSDKMRLEAIRALRNNNSPEVTKFLENLIQ